MGHSSPADGYPCRLLVRLVAGPCCDRFGPRKTFAGTLLLGAIPTFCSGAVTTPAGLYVVRFFIGILGGSFVPCQVWTTAFFDKNIVGTANALTAGIGNAGGGITYFVMPAVYVSLVNHQHLTSHLAWRISFIVPGVLIVFMALMMLLCCPDTPTGTWSERNTHIEDNLRRHSMVGVVDIPHIGIPLDEGGISGHVSPTSPSDADEKKDIIPPTHPHFTDHEANLTVEQMMDTAQGEVIRKPTFKEFACVFASPQTFVTGVCYFCSFGAELAINSILGQYYGAAGQFSPKLSTSQAGNYAAIFGLVNVVFRPLGGVIADYAYSRTGSVWSKKALLHIFACITGAFLIAIGVLNSHNLGTMIGLIIGMAFFLEASNGINFSVVPHVHPYANGIVSGITGASGNLGGVVFALIFRFVPAGPTHYGHAIWIIGVITIALNLAVCWIPPVPKRQRSDL